MSQVTLNAPSSDASATADSNHQQYQAFQLKREQLLTLIHRQASILKDLEMEGRADILQTLEERVQADNFKVLVLGEFKRGKSTFINAMLGSEILPAYAKPCTAIINEVKWGDPARALLHYEGTESDPAPEAQEVPVEELESYVVIQDGQSEREAIHNAPYEKVELFWPLELCRNGVEIIDSPGLNEHAIRQKVTMDYLSGVDAILFVLSCEALGSQSEMDVIENTLVKMGHQDIFFICNRFHAIRKKERESVRDYSIQKLAPFTEKGKERVYFIDALDALEGRLEGDQALVAESGVPLLEQDLERFLATEKGRIKLMRSLQELRNATQEARRVIPERTAMLRTDGATLEARYAEAQEPLRQLEQKRGQMQAQLRNFQADMQLTVSDRAREFYRDMADKVEGWAMSYELQSPVKFVSTKFLHQQIKIATEELVEHLSAKVEREVMHWQQSELQPLVEERLEQRKQVLESIASDFVDQVDELRLQVSGLGAGALSAEVAETDVGRRKVGAMERVLSAAGGFLIGGVGSASMGAIFGYEEMLKSLLPQIVLGIAAITLVGTNPLLLIPIMTGGGVIQGMLKTNGTNAKLKLAVAEKFAMQLRGSSYEQAEGMAKAVAAELGKLEAAVDDGLAAEIAGVRSQVESILAEKQRGQAAVDKKLAELGRLSGALNEVDGELDRLMAEVAMPVM